MSTSTFTFSVHTVLTMKHLDPLNMHSWPEADSEQQFLAALDKLCFWDVTAVKAGGFGRKVKNHIVVFKGNDWSLIFFFRKKTRMWKSCEAMVLFA